MITFAKPLAVLTLAVAVLVAGPASARVTANGVQVNGVQVNGVQVNGVENSTDAVHVIGIELPRKTRWRTNSRNGRPAAWCRAAVGSFLGVLCARPVWRPLFSGAFLPAFPSKARQQLL